MIGGLFAGHEQSGGDTIEQNGRVSRRCVSGEFRGGRRVVLFQKYKLFYGMSSDTAMHKHHGSVADYRASEGKTITVPYRLVFITNIFRVSYISNASWDAAGRLSRVLCITIRMESGVC